MLPGFDNHAVRRVFRIFHLAHIGMPRPYTGIECKREGLFMVNNLSGGCTAMISPGNSDDI